MAFHSWQEPVALLEASVGPPEPALVDLSKSLGLRPSVGETRLALVARIQDAVASVTGVRPPRPRTQAQSYLLNSLGADAGRASTVREADALIRISIARERIDALRRLRPTRGDRIIRVASPRGPDRTGEIIEITSIDRLGQLWSKAAGGHPTLPQHVVRSD